ncbi:hypothetical protein CUS27_13560 [Enterococcus faecalis]|nr:hypothetical protein [Enterococcus faecalis]EGO8433556.1 hypothetical protein [Enterococcus faecalis]EGO8436582.1 hypothetical protein [Enterococcus faecalis]EGO8459181.1 hypothetical protein [Enterococcus faecalis]EGO8493283.1 hypothetical protein [Enterococcus faecalis]
MFCPLFDLPIINRNIYDLPGIMYQMDHGTSRNKFKKQQSVGQKSLWVFAPRSVVFIYFNVRTK